MADTQIPAAAPQAQGQINTSVEADKAPAQAETKDLSSQFAHLAKKEKVIREQQRKFQAERDAFMAERESWKTQNLAKYQGFEERVSKDPIGLLEERGITRDQLASLLLNAENPDTNVSFQLQQENKELRAKIDQINKRFEDNEKGAYEGAINQIRNDAKILISSDPAEYELAGRSGENAIEAIVELCKIAWNEDQVLLPVEDAAKQVEQYLLEQSIELASANKVKAKLSPAEQAAQQTPQNQSKTPQSKTLNSQSAQATAGPMSRRQRAIMAFKGQL